MQISDFFLSCVVLASLFVNYKIKIEKKETDDGTRNVSESRGIGELSRSLSHLRNNRKQGLIEQIVSIPTGREDESQRGL